MKIKIIILSFCILSINKVHSQLKSGRSIVEKDSIDLVIFWKSFKGAIDSGNKSSLANYFNYPFYCFPCLDYLKPVDSTTTSIKVSKPLFVKSVYKLFFDLPVLNEYNKELWLKDFVFAPSYEENSQKLNGYVFSYVRISPNSRTDGSQGFVYLKRIKGEFKIVGVDTVP